MSVSPVVSLAVTRAAASFGARTAYREGVAVAGGVHLPGDRETGDGSAACRENVVVAGR
ncbi:hypothetical protein [Streptomyces sp. NPDC005017]|uniref:hypothetical protein n=1 Tax=Streptomyces sp. NPDC005017 TaxID=3364706 RepID=UPI0036C3839C